MNLLGAGTINHDSRISRNLLASCAIRRSQRLDMENVPTRFGKFYEFAF